MKCAIDTCIIVNVINDYKNHPMPTKPRPYFRHKDPCSRLVIHDGRMYFLCFVKIYQPLILLNEKLLILWASWSFAQRRELYTGSSLLGDKVVLHIVLANPGQSFLLVPSEPICKCKSAPWGLRPRTSMLLGVRMRQHINPRFQYSINLNTLTKT